jgi:hypothetical protein
MLFKYYRESRDLSENQFPFNVLVHVPHSQLVKTGNVSDIHLKDFIPYIRITRSGEY